MKPTLFAVAVVGCTRINNLTICNAEFVTPKPHAVTTIGARAATARAAAARAAAAIAAAARAAVERTANVRKFVQIVVNLHNVAARSAAARAAAALAADARAAAARAVVASSAAPACADADSAAKLRKFT